MPVLSWSWFKPRPRPLLLALPQRIRGFGHVKRAQGEEAERRRAVLWRRWQEMGKAGATEPSAAGHPVPA